MNVTQFLMPLFVVSKIFGMCPFQLTRNRYRTNKINTGWAYGFLASYASVTLVVLMMPSGKNNGSIMSFTDSLQVFVSLIGSVITNFNFVLKRKEVKFTFTRLFIYYTIYIFRWYQL